MDSSSPPPPLPFLWQGLEADFWARTHVRCKMLTRDDFQRILATYLTPPPKSGRVYIRMSPQKSGGWGGGRKSGRRARRGVPRLTRAWYLAGTLRT
eukprot:1009998-Rhodomonas_salina.2